MSSMHSAGRSGPALPKCVRIFWGARNLLRIESAQRKTGNRSFWFSCVYIIFPRNEDAGNLNEIVGLLAVCHANGLLDGHVAHVERPLRDNGLNDVLL